ncbi:hypothetical protein CATMIT_01682, partial [Catenibacterium mitsuokai DSM 15897]
VPALRYDDAAARAAQGLVGGRGDHVRVRHRARVDAGGDQAGDVGHIDEQIRADLVGDGAEARPIHHLRVSAEAGHDHLRLVLQGQALDFVVIDQALVVDAVLHGVEQLARGVDLGAVGRWPPWARLIPKMVSPGLSRAKYTAWLACEPECGCTLA